MLCFRTPVSALISYINLFLEQYCILAAEDNVMEVTTGEMHHWRAVLTVSYLRFKLE